MWAHGKGAKDRVKATFSPGQHLLAREVRYPRCDHNSYEFRLFPFEDVRERCETTPGSFYECITHGTGQNVRLYWDFDQKIDVPAFCRALSTFGVKEVTLLDACEVSFPVATQEILSFLGRKPKFSVHLICDLVFQDVKHLDSWVKDVFLTKFPDFPVDLSVLSRDRLFRLVGNTKLGSNRPLENRGVFCAKTFRRLRAASVRDTLVSVRGEKVFPYTIPPVPQNPRFKRIGHKEVIDLDVPRQSSLDFYLKFLPLQSERATWIKVLACLKGLGAKASDIWRWDSRLATDRLGFCRSRQCFVEQYKRISIFKKDPHTYLQAFFRTKEKFETILDEAYGLSEKNVTKKVHLDFISKMPVSEERCTFYKSQTGTGKSTMVRQYLKKEDPKRCLYVCSSKALCYNVTKSLNKALSRFGSLKRFRTYTSTRNPLETFDWLVVTVQSLGRAFIQENVGYCVVVFDEGASCFEDLTNTTCKHPSACQECLVKVFESKRTKKFILADAHVSDKEVNLVKSFLPCEVVVNTWSSSKHAILYPGIETKEGRLNKTGQQFYKELLEDVKARKKIFYVCNSTKLANILLYNFKTNFCFVSGSEHFIPELAGLICSFLPPSSFKAMWVHRDDGRSPKECFEAPELSWLVDLLIYSSKVTCGVDFNPKEPWFDLG